MPVAGLGVRWCLPDGYRLGVWDLLHTLDGWEPETLRGGMHYGNRATDPDGPADPLADVAWSALAAGAARRGQTQRASKEPRRSEYSDLRAEALGKARKIWAANTSLTQSAVASVLLRRWSEAGIEPLPSPGAVRGWIAGYKDGF